MGIKIQCDQHPTRVAWWQCRLCSAAMCPDCIVRRKGGFNETKDVYLCPKCNVYVDDLDISHVVEPFWKRLNKFFIYPFSSLAPVCIILVLALLSTIAELPGLIFFIIRFFLWGVMLKYAYEALCNTAEGSLDPPPISERLFSGNFIIVFKQVALFFALFLVAGFLATLGSVGILALIFFLLTVVLLLPSMIIILAVNDSLGKALNPVYSIGIAVRIGWAYLLLLFLLSILLFAPGVLGYYVIQYMPESLQLFLWNAASNYYALVSYHLMGYVILQYHERLDFSVDPDALIALSNPGNKGHSAEETGKSSVDPQAELMREAGFLIQEGDLDGAITLIEERTRLDDINHLGLSERYVQLVQTQDRTESLLRYAPHHLDLLVRASEREKAVAFYSLCIQKSDDFAPSALALFKIGGWLNEGGEAREAVRSFNFLIKRYPKDALVPKTFYQAARLLHEKLNNTAKAKTILHMLVKKYPEHDIARFAREYLATL